MTEICPVCAQAAEISDQDGADPDDYGNPIPSIIVKCVICGRYAVDNALPNYLQDLSAAERAGLSHKVRLVVESHSGRTAPFLKISIDDRSKWQLPLASEQARNIIRFIGLHERQSGDALDNAPDHFPASIGAINRQCALVLVGDLKKQGKLTATDVGDKSGPDWAEMRLTLDGWNQYESIATGRQPGKHGFIALKFGDTELDNFVAKHVRPATEALGYPLEDMRIAARAGVIDDLMRQHIRDAAFVLADLTHQNLGAYWEAGYAEGLGKPTIYLCRSDVFSPEHVHFDTNHCTTVKWSVDSTDKFKAELTAVLRRSLGLFV